MAVRCPFDCRPEPGGPWVPAFAGKTRGRKAGAQEPQWCRGHGTDLSAAGSPPARCLSALERKHPPCRGGHGGSMPSWLPSRARWSLDPGVRREGDERVLRQIEPSAFFRFLRALFVSPAKAGAQEPRWCRGHGADLSAVSFPPARCSGPLEEQQAPCRGGCGGSMPFWLPSRARWSLDPGVRRENDERALRQIGPSAFFRFLRALFVSPAKAGAQEPQWCRCHGNGSQRSGYSAGTMLGCS